ncbi:MAG: hypothetical protein Q4D26_03170 [Clostridia bacterium]|nr:hypothetical protein [Clostridia bacterium]
MIYKKLMLLAAVFALLTQHFADARNITTSADASVTYPSQIESKL